MKKLLLTTIVFLSILSSTSFAQTKVDKFCQVYMQPKGAFSFKFVPVLSIGEHTNLMAFKDSGIISALQTVSTFGTDVDVMNYMASIGWSLVSITKTASEFLYFKREFDKSELSGN